MIKGSYGADNWAQAGHIWYCLKISKKQGSFYCSLCNRSQYYEHFIGLLYHHTIKVLKFLHHCPMSIQVLPIPFQPNLLPHHHRHTVFRYLSSTNEGLLSILFSPCFLPLYTIYEWNHLLFIVLPLTYFTYHGALQFDPSHSKWLDFIFPYSCVIFHCVYIPLLYPLICLWTYRLFSYHVYCA